MQNGLRAVVMMAVAGTLFMAGSAWADDTPLPADRQQELLDRNPAIDADGDGVVTRDEARQFFRSEGRRGRGGPDGDSGRRRGFKGGEDGDDDGPPGKGGRRGRSAGRGGPGGPGGPDGMGRGMRGGMGGMMDPAKMLEKYPDADTDKDGKLSRDEARAFIKSQGGMRAFALKEHPEWDTDGDGKLSPEEMRAGIGAVASTRPWGRGPGFDRLGVGQRERMAEKLMKEHPEADTDGDGRLSREECEAYMKAHPEIISQHLLKRFPDADTDKDGVLSQEELEALKGSRPGGGPKLRHGKPSTQPAQ